LNDSITNCPFFEEIHQRGNANCGANWICGANCGANEKSSYKKVDKNLLVTA